ncbi:four helix bundle protein [Deinococcus aetherius]|uniref:Four helix bundle protein n=1 Tax=Deinococcus aetherius TaxID=200252 RepID=A0ABM8AG27_9DEIO|nr:four helix bundle protein [Deinococcus aetherius]BDP42742.1 four helix bundle protein [Deinococcus aetherius]
MRDFRTLAVWQKAHALTLGVYVANRAFPGEERFGLTSQLRRAALSIPTNIAEGCGRQAEGDSRRFLEIAAGSASETEYLLLLAGDLDYLQPQPTADLLAQTQEVKRMLSAFTARLRTP